MKVQANGIRVNCELTGREDGPVVMMCHSLASSLRMWDAQMEALYARFRVLRYDLRGHGGSEAVQGPYSLELLAKDAVGLLDALGIEKAHFVGLSIGGMIGQALAIHHGDRLHSLVLCDTAPRTPAEARPIWRERIETAKRDGVGSLLDVTLERWFTPSFPENNPAALAVIKEAFLATSLEGYVGCIEAIANLDFLDRLTEIRLPTLILVGEDDQGTPVTASMAIRERIPGSDLVVIPAARHLSNVECPDAFNAALTGFLARVA